MGVATGNLFVVFNGSSVISPPLSFLRIKTVKTDWLRCVALPWIIRFLNFPVFLQDCCNWISDRSVSRWPLGSVGSLRKLKLGNSERVWDLGVKSIEDTQAVTWHQVSKQGKGDHRSCGSTVRSHFQNHGLRWESGEPVNISIAASLLNKQKTPSKILHG